MILKETLPDNTVRRILHVCGDDPDVDYFADAYMKYSSRLWR